MQIKKDYLAKDLLFIIDDGKVYIFTCSSSFLALVGPEVGR